MISPQPVRRSRRVKFGRSFVRQAIPLRSMPAKLPGMQAKDMNNLLD